jgi:hypothetical protein
MKIERINPEKTHSLLNLKIALGTFSLFFILSISCYSWTQTTSPLSNDGVGLIFSYNNSIYNFTESYYTYYSQWSQMSSDGSLGVWNESTESYLVYEYGYSWTSYGPYVYTSGGYYLIGIGGDIPMMLNDVHMATVGVNGVLSDLSPTSGMVESRQGHSMVTYNGYMYAIGGSTLSFYNPEVFLNSVEFSKISTDGTLSSWQETLALSTVSGGISGGNFSWIANGYLYVMGTNGQTERSLINEDGTLAGWQFIGYPFPNVNVPQNITYASDGYLYGTFGNGTVLRVQVNINGTFGNVEAIEPLPTGGSIAAVQNYIYALGGGTTGTDVYYRLADGDLCDLNFDTALDTTQLVFENAPSLTSQPTISWLSTYNGATGVLQIQFTQPNQGVKMTLIESDWFSSISNDWYELKAQVYCDVTTYPNEMFGVGNLYNGAYNPPMDINGHGIYSTPTTGWFYLRDFQQSYGGVSMYPQLTFKNNDTYPANFYLESVEVEPISQPGN